MCAPNPTCGFEIGLVYFGCHLVSILSMLGYRSARYGETGSGLVDPMIWVLTEIIVSNRLTCASVNQCWEYGVNAVVLCGILVSFY